MYYEKYRFRFSPVFDFGMDGNALPVRKVSDLVHHLTLSHNLNLISVLTELEFPISEKYTKQFSPDNLMSAVSV